MRWRGGKRYEPYVPDDGLTLKLATPAQVVLFNEELAGQISDGGPEKLMEHYNGFSDFLGDEAQEALNSNSDLGEEIEQYMNIALAKKFAKYAGGKFIPHGGIK